MLYYITNGFGGADIALFLARVVLGTFYVLARFRFFYDPSKPEVTITSSLAYDRWNPDKGKFSTFLVPRIRGAMLDYAADQARWASLTKSQPITQENASDEYYDDWEGAPFDPEAAWDSPEATIQDGAQNDTATDDVSYEATLGAELREAIALLEAQLHNDIVLRYYQDNSIDHIAKLNGVSRQTVHSRIKQAIEILRSILVTDCPK
jgi:RNA polymerase sigma factor (sigma-70 family)